MHTAGPFAVVVSDMQMPAMDGVTFLGRVHETSPDTVRVMLTGNADQTTAMKAINEGHIFRFLVKPCRAEDLAEVLDSALHHYQLLTSEKELRTKTLTGAVRVMSDLLSYSNPAAHGRTQRIQSLVSELAGRVDGVEVWECAIAAMLSQIGCVQIPDEVFNQALKGEPVEGEWRDRWQQHPKIAQELVGKIPRLEGAAEIIGGQSKQFDGGGYPEDGVAGTNIPSGARLLKVVIDFDSLTHGGLDSSQALRELQSRDGWYDPQILSLLASYIRMQSTVALSVPLDSLQPGMVLAADVTSIDGKPVSPRGQLVTETTLDRFKRLHAAVGLQEPIQVLPGEDAETSEPSPADTSEVSSG